MGKTYRILVLKYPLGNLYLETAEKVAQPLKVQQEFRRWAEEWLKNNGNAPFPEKAMKFR